MDLSLAWSSTGVASRTLPRQPLFVGAITVGSSHFATDATWMSASAWMSRHILILSPVNF
jgi:hypothetical protein